MVSYPISSFNKKCIGLARSNTFIGSFGIAETRAKNRIDEWFLRNLGPVNSRGKPCMIKCMQGIEYFRNSASPIVIKTSITLDKLNPIEPQIGYIGRIAALDTNKARMFLQNKRHDKREKFLNRGKIYGSKNKNLHANGE
jgi:hypothetical protein